MDLNVEIYEREVKTMDVGKYVSLAIGIAIIAVIIGVMSPIVAENLLATTGDNVLANASTINTLIQLLMLFVPIVVLLAIVKGAMTKN